jgi:hypothetical protein
MESGLWAAARHVSRRVLCRYLEFAVDGNADIAEDNCRLAAIERQLIFGCDVLVATDRFVADGL